MSDEILNQIKSSLLSLDPIYYAEKYLTLDGKPFTLRGGYKPFSDIYRYIAIKALEKDSKPVIIVKGRQVGATTMASALEMYFMGCGLFGNANNPPIRIIHAFPQLDLAYAYSKTKLNPMITNSVSFEQVKKGQKGRSYMQSLLDQTSSRNDSLNFKQFVGGNHIWIESTGETADRLRGRSSDIIFFDECFPYEQCIETNKGKEKIGRLVRDFLSGKPMPLVKTFNEITEEFEYKRITNAWEREKRTLVQISCGNREIKCTPNHRFLTASGWKRADELVPSTLIKTSNSTNLQIRALNDDQMQIVLGSFLGDGHLSSHKTGRYRLREIHGENQREYCEWKASMFGATTKQILNNGFAKKPAVQFATKSFALPNALPKTKTSCPQWVLDAIDARGIAIWFMDDGSIQKWKNGAAGVISTCSFDEDSQNRIVAKLKSLGIDCHYSSYNNRFSIYINKNGFEKLCETIRPYIHNNISYKLNYTSNDPYSWNNQFKTYGYTVVDRVTAVAIPETVFDIEVEDNHNFIVTSCRKSKNLGGLLTHNCQDIAGRAIGNATKMLAKANYGKVGDGVQVYFGTPKQRGSEFFEMWSKSSQQYFNLHCSGCNRYFPLYTPGTDDWEKTWIHGFTVKCPHCNHEQDKRDAAEKGKWIATQSPDECPYIGFHMSQLFIPEFSKEKIISEKPGNSPINTERAYQNEVLGEFFSGETGIMTPEDIREKCGDHGRKFRAHIPPGAEQAVFMGIDIGAKSDMEQLADNSKLRGVGQSYSCVVIASLAGPKLLQIEFAAKFKRNDFASKKAFIDHLMRIYNVNICVCDIGFSNDFCEIMQNEYGDKFLASNALPRILDKVKFQKDIFPKVIQFEKDFSIGELYEQMKKGHIRFPYGDYEKVNWLIQHCTSMEIKPSSTRSGDMTPRYVKGATPNDGFMALLNCYFAYKFFATQGFTIKNPLLFNNPFEKRQFGGLPISIGTIPRMR